MKKLLISVSILCMSLGALAVEAEERKAFCNLTANIAVESAQRAKDEKPNVIINEMKEKLKSSPYTIQNAIIMSAVYFGINMSGKATYEQIDKYQYLGCLSTT